MDTQDREAWRDKLFSYALTLDKPMEEYQKMIKSSEERLDPELDKVIEEHPNRDWLRST